MDFTERQRSFTAYGIVLLFFLCVWGGVYWLQSGPDCIKIKIDGSIRCACDYQSSDDWQNFKEDTHGAWEAVVFDNGVDPCKGKSASNTISSATASKSESENNDLVEPTTEIMNKPEDSTTPISNSYDAHTIQEAVINIRKKYYAINYKTLDVDSIKANDNFQADLTIVYYNKNSQVEKITTVVRGASIVNTKEYYFIDNKLYFIYEYQNGTNSGKPYEIRTYIYNNQVIKMLENGIEIGCEQNCNYNQQSEPYSLLKNYYENKLHFD